MAQATAMRRLSAGAAFFAALAVAACSAPRQNVDLSTAPARTAAAPLIAVNEPVAPAPADGERIVVRGAAGDVYLLGGAQWADRATRLAQRRLIVALNAAGVAAVLPGAVVVAALRVDFQRFEIDAARETAVVDFTATLYDDRTGKAVARAQFSGAAPAPGVSAQGAAPALGAALDQAGARLAHWLRMRPRAPRRAAGD